MPENYDYGGDDNPEDDMDPHGVATTVLLVALAAVLLIAAWIWRQ